MFQNLGLQLYTVRDYLQDPEFADLTFRRLRELGYAEAQTAGFAPFDPVLFSELLKKNGIRIVGTHYNYRKIIDEPEETIALHRMWGTNNIGLGMMPPDARASLDGLKKFIRDFNGAAELYAKEGFRLTYHNHNFEFERVDGYRTRMEILAEEFDPKNISFVLDTCWVAAGGGDVRAWMERLAGRIDILHLKDYSVNLSDGSYRPRVCLAEVGYGNLDWNGILETAEKIGVKHYVVEQDENFTRTPFESLRMSAEFLKKYQK